MPTWLLGIRKLRLKKLNLMELFAPGKWQIMRVREVMKMWMMKKKKNVLNLSMKGRIKATCLCRGTGRTESRTMKVGRRRWNDECTKSKKIFFFSITNETNLQNRTNFSP